VSIIGIEESVKVKIIITVIAGNKKSITLTFESPITGLLPQTSPTIIVQTIGKMIPKISDHGFLINLKKLSL